jgi:hypothetical protein
MRGSAAVRVRLQGVDDTGNSLRARLDGHGGLQRDADPVHRGNGGQQRNVSGRAAAARSRHVAENPRIFAPKNVSWELNVLYDAPCARREPVRRRGGDRLAGIHRPSAGTRADRGGLSAVERACAWSDQLHVPLTTGPTDSSQVPGASGRPVLRKAAWPMLGHDFALLAAVVVSLVGIGSEESRRVRFWRYGPHDVEVRRGRRLATAEVSASRHASLAKVLVSGQNRRQRRAPTRALRCRLAGR